MSTVQKSTNFVNRQSHYSKCFIITVSRRLAAEMQKWGLCLRWELPS